jgi:hypothetical protein
MPLAAPVNATAAPLIFVIGYLLPDESSADDRTQILTSQLTVMFAFDPKQIWSSSPERFFDGTAGLIDRSECIEDGACQGVKVVDHAGVKVRLPQSVCICRTLVAPTSRRLY